MVVKAKPNAGGVSSAMLTFSKIGIQDPTRGGRVRRFQVRRGVEKAPLFAGLSLWVGPQRR
jgi:hypothetical protein